jgi:hypothetical protein
VIGNSWFPTFTLELSPSNFTRSIPHEGYKLGEKEVLENLITQHFGDIVIVSIHLSIFQSLVILPLNRGYRNENVFTKTLGSSLPPLGS